MREEAFSYIKKKYKTTPEYPWAKDNTSAVFRHSDNKKWFALAMCVGRNKLGLSEEGDVDALNLKIGLQCCWTALWEKIKSAT